jgi:hypothetical protein
MYRKTLIALACAVISAPAFAQSPCGLFHQPPGCSYLNQPTWRPSTSEPKPFDGRLKQDPFEDRRSSSRYWTGPDPKPPSTFDLGKRLDDMTFRPTWNRGPAVQGKW